MPNRLLVAGLASVLCVVAAGVWARPARGQCNGGTPPVPSEPRIAIPPPIRVIDGETLELFIEGRRTAVGLVGVRAPMGNTPCGREATEMLRALVADGIEVVPDPERELDERGRRPYYAYTPDGQSLAVQLAHAGLVEPDGHGREHAQIATAAADARVAGRGCR